MKRFCSGILVIVLTLFAPATAVPAEEQASDAQAQALLQKHRDFVGFQFGDGTFRTMRISGTLTNKKGEKIEDIAFSSAGLAFQETRTMVKQGDTEAHRGFTGSVFWQCFRSGFTMPIYGEAAKAMASYVMLMQEGTSGLPGTFKGNKTVDGKTVALVRVTMNYGDPIDLYIDPTTGAYVRAVINQDGPYEATIDIDSYADVVAGKKMIGTYHIDQSDQEHANTKFEPNADVTNEELHPPTPAASWTFSSGQAVPIHLTYDRILVDATVNGVKGTFILDTGSDAIRLDETFADRVGLEALKGESDANSVYGVRKERIRRIKDLSFGNATLHDTLAYSEDFTSLTGWKGLDGKGYAGLIGADFFAGAIVKLDVYDSQMTILDPNATDMSTNKGLPIFVDLSGGELTVPMKLDNSLIVNAVLDTGNPGSILFSYDLVRKHVPFNPTMLTLGPIQYGVGSWHECCLGANYALLGFDFLKHFDYIFDYPHGRMFMTLNKN